MKPAPPSRSPDRGADEPGRRGTYFAFQGLLMAVLVLLFLYQYRGVEGWVERFAFLVLTLGASLVFVRLAPAGHLSDWRFQAGLFLWDAGLATLTLHWTQPQSDLYLLYTLIIFGTALTRNLRHSVAIALGTSLLYLLTAWHPALGIPDDPGFWLRFCFLWILTILLAILSRDTQRLQWDQERKYIERLTQIERLAALGQMAGEVAHRIKGPLTTILVNAEVLSHRGRPSRRSRRELEQIQEEARRCKEILKNLLDLGRIEELDFALLDLREPLGSALDAVAPQTRRRAIRLETFGLEDPRWVLGDQSLLHEAVAAVLQNAVEAVSDSGTIRAGIYVRRPRPWWLGGGGGPGWLALVVEDDGAGIEPEDLERVFQPFFTTKGTEGSGLGLSAALRILQKHGGSVEAHSDGPGQGARFALILPETEPNPRGKKS